MESKVEVFAVNAKFLASATFFSVKLGLKVLLKNTAAVNVLEVATLDSNLLNSMRGWLLEMISDKCVLRINLSAMNSNQTTSTILGKFYFKM